jgi:hypothetical protein
VNRDGIERKGFWYKFFHSEPTFTNDYQPVLDNPWNLSKFVEIYGYETYKFLKGPHPEIVVTRSGYISYGSGRNTFGQYSFQGRVIHGSIHRVELNSNYFHKY